jgi:hypothetical protein
VSRGIPASPGPAKELFESSAENCSCRVVDAVSANICDKTGLSVALFTAFSTALLKETVSTGLLCDLDEEFLAGLFREDAVFRAPSSRTDVVPKPSDKISIRHSFTIPLRADLESLAIYPTPSNPSDPVSVGKSRDLTLVRPAITVNAAAFAGSLEERPAIHISLHLTLSFTLVAVTAPADAWVAKDPDETTKKFESGLLRTPFSENPTFIPP